MKLPPDVIRYIMTGHVVITFLINIGVNAVVGFVSFRGADDVSTWAMQHGAAADTIGTCFFLPFITCLIATPIVRHQRKNGAVSGIPMAKIPHWLQAFNGWIVVRAFKFGLCTLALMAGPIYGGYWLLAPDTIAVASFLAFKTLFAASLGILVTPLIAILELAGPSADSV